MLKNTKEHIYYVKGMHCASCEILIEKKLLELENIKSVEASTAKSEVLVEYEDKKPTLEKLNEIFKKDGHVFFDKSKETVNPFDPNELITTIIIGLLIVIGFIGLTKMGLSELINVNSTSSLPTFFIFGLIAGVSSCAALVGGIILSMSKQWGELYSDTNSTWKKIQPHLIFNIGRLISYGFFGAILGLVGNKLNFSLNFTPILVLIISVIMIFLALQMFGFKAFRKFQFTMPKFITRYIADETKFQGKYMPFLMGVFTFFLPCGFTITAQGLALGRFLRIAGILVLFFAFYNINAQLNVLGFSSFNNLINNSNQSQSEQGLPQIIDGKQILKMDASSSGYSPSYLKVKVGIPVQWEITDKGTSGCTNAVISKNLFEGEIPLTPGQTSIKKFTPEKPGKYKFSCWMGMISGTIEVIKDDTINNVSTQTNNATEVAPVQSSRSSCGSSSKGCGCGGCGGGTKIKKDDSTTIAKVESNVQIIKSIYTSSDYLQPNVFKVKTGQNVKFIIDIKDDGRGCSYAIMIPNLYNNAIPLSAGNTITMEFTPTVPGNYDITCGMGMINYGTIIVE
ncbi:cupredoxin domain-containing protein [Candidatus Kuenenbacteria bacterium]|nr:cupredoxin domain-containing protein [Candidatus Kuenenbacteria bacterium]